MQSICLLVCLDRVYLRIFIPLLILSTPSTLSNLRTLSSTICMFIMFCNCGTIVMAVCSCHCVLHLMLQIAFLLDDTVDTRMCICIKKSACIWYYAWHWGFAFVFGATVDTAFLPDYCTAMNLTAPRPLLLNNATTKPIIFAFKLDKTIYCCETISSPDILWHYII